MIYQTTIQRFFRSNGVDYAMAMDVENDIVLSETRSASFRIHSEWVLREKEQGVEYESSIARPDNTTHFLTLKGGTRVVIKTIPKAPKLK